MTGTHNLVLSYGSAAAITDAQTILYTLGSGQFNQNAYVTFYDGSIWVSQGNGTVWDKVYAFDFPSATPTFSASVALSGDTTSNWPVAGNIIQRAAPPGYAALVTNQSSGNESILQRLAFDSIAGKINTTLGSSTSAFLTDVVSEDSVNALFCSTVNGGIYKFSSLNWNAGTATLTVIGNPSGWSGGLATLTSNAGVIDSRVYLYSSITSGRIAWIHSSTHALTTLATYANVTGKPTIGNQFNEQAGSIYIESGNANEANVIQKRTLDGTLTSSLTIAALSTTTYGQVRLTAYDFVKDRLWIQTLAAADIYVIDCATMTLLHSFTPARSAKLMGPIGHQDGGAFVLTKSAGGNYDQVERAYLTG